MKIIALQNFGHAGRVVETGEVLDVQPEDFGGTFDSFVENGFLSEAVQVKGEWKPKTSAPEAQPKATKAKAEKPVEPAIESPVEVPAETPANP